MTKIIVVIITTLAILLTSALTNMPVTITTHAQLQQQRTINGCPQTTSDPQLNQLFCNTNSLIANIGAQKDSSYDPPSSIRGLSNKCETQANNNNQDPQNYCNGIFQSCHQNSFTVEECYAQFFTSAEAPTQVFNSLMAKMNAVNAGLDTGLAIQRAMPPKSGFGAMNPDCVGASC